MERMMFDTFWQFYQDYDASYQASGDPGQQAMASDDVTFELRISMGIPRAKMKVLRHMEVREPATEAAVRAFAERHGFALDFRDDSWVLTGAENLYYGRVLATEVWFTPEKFADRRDLLSELAGMYVTHGTPVTV